MKTITITTLLAVGMLLRPQPVLTTDTGIVPDNAVAIGAVQQAGPQALAAAERCGLLHTRHVVGEGAACEQEQARSGRQTSDQTGHAGC